jgi:hypothetical protein
MNAQQKRSKAHTKALHDLSTVKTRLQGILAGYDEGTTLPGPQMLRKIVADMEATLTRRTIPRR